MEKDILKGNIFPSFFLCKKTTYGNKRTEFKVQRYGTRWASPLYIVPSLTDTDYLIEFLSSYRFSMRTKGIKFREKNPYRKVFPKGALFWFECNSNGKPTGMALFVKNIPDKKYGGINDQGWRYVQKHKEYIESLDLQYNDLLSDDFNSSVYIIEDPKIQLPQFERHAEARKAKAKKKGKTK